jgi:hypothetical protein
VQHFVVRIRALARWHIQLHAHVLLADSCRRRFEHFVDERADFDPARLRPVPA